MNLKEITEKLDKLFENAKLAAKHPNFPYKVFYGKETAVGNIIIRLKGYSNKNDINIYEIIVKNNKKLSAGVELEYLQEVTDFQWLYDYFVDVIDDINYYATEYLRIESDKAREEHNRVMALIKAEKQEKLHELQVSLALEKLTSKVDK